MNETPVVEGEVRVNPLMKYESTRLADFAAWEKRWNDEGSVEVRLGLLHTLETKYWDWKESRKEILDFLLNHSDGWREGEEHFRTSSGENRRGQDRKKLAAKAFSVLCRCFLSKKRESPHLSENFAWIWILGDKEALQALVDFFVLPTGGCKNCFSSSCSKEGSDDKITSNFLFDLAKCGWTQSHVVDSIQWNRVYFDTKELLITLQPRFIEVFDEARQLHWFLTLHGGRYVDLNEASMQKLRDIALRHASHLPHMPVTEQLGDTLRVPRNIEEAVYGRSQAAAVYAIHDILRKQRELFQAFEESLRLEKGLRQKREEAVKG
jgi:hypothetical protein